MTGSADIDVDFSDARLLAEHLDRFATKALPHASRAAINASAFEGRKEWERQIGVRLVLRNTFTVRSLRVEKANGLRVEGMRAVLGSVAPYMDEQEEGAVIRGKTGAKPIPTSVAAGQAASTRPRTKAVRRPNWMTNIKLPRMRGRAGRSQKQRNAMATRLAAEGGKGKNVVLLEHGNKRGLFRVTGRKRVTVRLLWDLSKRSVRVPASSTLQRTLKAIEPRLPIIHRDALIGQLQRYRLLGFSGPSLR